MTKMKKIKSMKKSPEGVKIDFFAHDYNPRFLIKMPVHIYCNQTPAH